MARVFTCHEGATDIISLLLTGSKLTGLSVQAKTLKLLLNFYLEPREIKSEVQNETLNTANRKTDNLWEKKIREKN